MIWPVRGAENAKSAAIGLGGVNFSSDKEETLLEVLALASATTGLVLFSRRPSAGQGSEAAIEELGAEDLPCPWCLAPTLATDIRCPSCGRRFG